MVGFLWGWQMAYLLPGASAIFITNAGAGSADAEKQVPRCGALRGIWSPAGLPEQGYVTPGYRDTIDIIPDMLHVWYIYLNLP